MSWSGPGLDFPAMKLTLESLGNQYGQSKNIYLQNPLQLFVLPSQIVVF